MPACLSGTGWCPVVPCYTRFTSSSSSSFFFAWALIQGLPTAREGGEWSGAPRGGVGHAAAKGKGKGKGKGRLRGPAPRPQQTRKRQIGDASDAPEFELECEYGCGYDGVQDLSLILGCVARLPRRHGRPPHARRTVTAHRHSTHSQHTFTAHSHSPQAQHTVTAHSHSTQSQHIARTHPAWHRAGSSWCISHACHAESCWGLPSDAVSVAFPRLQARSRTSKRTRRHWHAWLAARTLTAPIGGGGLTAPQIPHWHPPVLDLAPDPDPPPGAAHRAQPMPARRRAGRARSGPSPPWSRSKPSWQRCAATSTPRPKPRRRDGRQPHRGGRKTRSTPPAGPTSRPS